MTKEQNIFLCFNCILYVILYVNYIYMLNHLYNIMKIIFKFLKKN